MLLQDKLIRGEKTSEKQRNYNETFPHHMVIDRPNVKFILEVPPQIKRWLFRTVSKQNVYLDKHFSLQSLFFFQRPGPENSLNKHSSFLNCARRTGYLEKTPKHRRTTCKLHTGRSQTKDGLWLFDGRRIWESRLFQRVVQF